MERDLRSVSRPTLKTIASATGLAVTTVSRALASDPQISERTRAVVRETAHKLGYVPDLAAQRLRTGRTRVVQVLLNLDHEFLGFSHDLLGGLTDALEGTGYSVTLFPDLVRTDRLTAVRRIVENRLGDGLIINRTQPNDPRVAYLTKMGFPFVSHGRTELNLPHPFVDFDNEAFGRAAVERLAEKGRSKILMIAPSAQYTFSHHLRRSVSEACRRRGLACEIPEEVTIETPATELSGWLRARLSKPDFPDAMICIGEVCAISTIAALSDLDMLPDRDVALVAKRASSIFSLMRPQIDTVFEDLWQTGRLMGQTLLRSMNAEPAETLGVLQSPILEFRL